MRKFAMLVLFAMSFGIGLAGVGHISVANAYPESPVDEIDGF